ncbi:type I restriction-modification system subunit M [Corynebacterium nuruki]|uniref:type I restriction-modification system subunit M n=1 Tax=Corynebacterium nuruki TaxID=1032851 RepID=UPI002FDF6DCE
MAPTQAQLDHARKTTYTAVWDTADKYLRNVVEPEEYGDFIIPFVVLRRLECILADSKPEVLALIAERTKDGTVEVSPTLMDLWIRTSFGLHFYNTSPLDLTTIGGTDDSVAESLNAYVAAFSTSIADIWDSFKFNDKVATLARAGRLYGVVNHFAGIDLHPDTMPDTAMGDLFEDVMYRAFNTKGKGAGAFYTPRDAIELMVSILLSSDDEGLQGAAPSRTIYDPAAGTGGMLLVAKRALEELNANMQVSLHGQELMDFSYGIGKADLLIQGGKPDSIRHGNTLTDDKYAGQTFDYVLTNPPYGSDWSADYAAVVEKAGVEGSRFSHGLPPKSDGQMLFLSHVAHKLTPAHGDTGGGRAGVVMNGSPLFTGGPGSGPDSIRRWLLTEDLVDAIIALPTDMFYGTGIATYIWILDTNKEPRRRGKVQLIDATAKWEPMRKGMGMKRRELSEDNRRDITRAYAAFEDSDISRILTPDDLGFRDVPVYRQRRLAVQVTDEAVTAAMTHRSATPDHDAVIRAIDGTEYNDLPSTLKFEATKAKVKMPAGLVDTIMNAVGVDDPGAAPAVDRKGNPVVVPGSDMVERIPLTEDVDEHMAREVLPFAPEAIWDRDKERIGYEIPFTRIFYVPEPVRSLEEIDADVAKVMDELAAMFKEVRE